MKLSNVAEMKFPGTTIASLKQHPPLIPIWCIMIFGGCLAAGYTARLAFRNPDVAWNKDGHNGNSNNYYSTRQYKFIDSYDCSKGPPAPDYTNFDDEKTE